MSVHTCLDVYAILWFESVHCLWLGIGRMLKKCIVYMLEDENRTASFIKCANENEKSFRAVKLTMPITLNKLLKCCAEHAPGYRLKIDIIKSGRSHQLTGFFNEGEAHCMLEASDFDLVDNVSLFLGGLLTVSVVSLKLVILLQTLPKTWTRWIFHLRVTSLLNVVMHQ